VLCTKTQKIFLKVSQSNTFKIFQYYSKPQ